jgi:hypothetical protein
MIARSTLIDLELISMFLTAVLLAPPAAARDVCEIFEGYVAHCATASKSTPQKNWLAG